MNDQLTPLQSLQLIQSMIAKTKGNMGENRFYFLLWGWMAFVCFVVQFLLKAVAYHPYHYLIWIAAFPATLITIWHARRRRHRAPRTYISDSMGYLWMGTGIVFFMLIFILSASRGWLHAYPFFILLYGLGTFVSGKILQFRPFVAGGMLAWLLAALCPFVPYDYQLLLAALAILVSYIIPAYLLHKQNQ